MRDAVDLEIAIGAALVVADLAPHALGEDLGAAARQRVEPRVLQRLEHLLVRHAVEIREERDLDGGEALEVDARPDSLEPAQQLQVVVERQIGMQAVDDVHFGERLVRARWRSLSHASSSDIVYEPGSPGFSRANEQNRQLATQTLVASSLMLKL